MKRIKFKPCPFCGRDIRTTQRKCPFCRRYLQAHIKARVDLTRNQKIVRLRDKGKTYRELGVKYNLSQERIRQIYRDFK